MTSPKEDTSVQSTNTNYRLNSVPEIITVHLFKKNTRGTVRGRRRTGKLGIDKGPKLFGLGLFSPSQQAPPPIQCSPWDPGHSNPIHPPSFLQTFVASVATHVVMEYFAQRNCPLSYILSTTKCDIVFFIHHCLLDLPQGQQDRPSSLGSLTMAVFSDPIN